MSRNGRQHTTKKRVALAIGATLSSLIGLSTIRSVPTDSAEPTNTESRPAEALEPTTRSRTEPTPTEPLNPHEVHTPEPAAAASQHSVGPRSAAAEVQWGDGWLGWDPTIVLRSLTTAVQYLPEFTGSEFSGLTVTEHDLRIHTPLYAYAIPWDDVLRVYAAPAAGGGLTHVLCIKTTSGLIVLSEFNFTDEGVKAIAAVEAGYPEKVLRVPDP